MSRTKFIATEKELGLEGCQVLHASSSLPQRVLSWQAHGSAWGTWLSVKLNLTHIRGVTSVLLWILLVLAAGAQQGGSPLADPPKPNDMKTKVPVHTIQVSGNRLLTNEEVRAIVKPYEGKALQFQEIEAIGKEIEDAYRAKGYLLVKAVVPPQDITLGLVELQVLEGKIGQILLEGNERYPSDFLRARFEDAVPEEGSKAADFQRALFLLNELPDLQLKAVLKAGEEPGTTDVVLRAEEDKNWHVGLECNNFGTRLTGEHRLGVTPNFSSVLFPGDRFVARTIFATPAQNTGFLQGSYSVPVTTSGTRVGVGYANGSYTVGREVAVLDIRGTANIFSFTVEQPLVRSLTHSSDLNFHLGYSDLDNRILGAQLSRDQYTSATLAYRGEWRDTNGRYLGSASVTKGLGGTRAGDPNASRLGADADFTRYNVDLARIQEFNSQLLGVLRGSIQIAGRPLFSAEQFAVGGPDTVRGFSQAEALGDQAYNATLELRWSPLPEDTNLFQTVFFLDHGAVTRLQPQPGETGTTKLTGTGVGFRVNYDQTRVRLDFGFPISPNRSSRGVSPAIYGQIQTRF